MHCSYTHVSKTYMNIQIYYTHVYVYTVGYTSCFYFLTFPASPSGSMSGVEYQRTFFWFSRKKINTHTHVYIRTRNRVRVAYNRILFLFVDGARERRDDGRSRIKRSGSNPKDTQLRNRDKLTEVTAAAVAH